MNLITHNTEPVFFEDFINNLFGSKGTATGLGPPKEKTKGNSKNILRKYQINPPAGFYR